MRPIAHQLTYSMLDTYQNYDLSSMNTMALSSVADTAIVIHDAAALPTLKPNNAWFVAVMFYCQADCMPPCFYLA